MCAGPRASLRCQPPALFHWFGAYAPAIGIIRVNAMADKASIEPTKDPRQENVSRRRRPKSRQAGANSSAARSSTRNPEAKAEERRPQHHAAPKTHRNETQGERDGREAGACSQAAATRSPRTSGDAILRDLYSGHAWLEKRPRAPPQRTPSCCTF